MIRYGSNRFDADGERIVDGPPSVNYTHTPSPQMAAVLDAVAAGQFDAAHAALAGVADPYENTEARAALSQALEDADRPADAITVTDGIAGSRRDADLLWLGRAALRRGNVAAAKDALGLLHTELFRDTLSREIGEVGETRA